VSRLLPALTALATAALLQVGIPAAARTPSVSPACQIRIPLPPDLSPADLSRPDAALRGRLRELERASLRALEDGPGPPAGDRILLFTDATGRPILPDRERALAAGRAQSATQLQFTFDSPDMPWSEHELACLSLWVADFYPVLEEIYGPPAFSITVNVAKDAPAYYTSGTYSPWSNEIRLSSFAGDVFCHEMAHAFRDDAVAFLDGFEEAMARYAEVEVFERLDAYRHWDEGRAYEYDAQYEAYNRPALGTTWGNFWESQSLVSLRYALGGYAWAKVGIEHPGFAREFNRRYYLALAESDTLQDSDRGLKQLAGDVAPVVEGEPFVDWVAGQHVLDTDAPPGPQILPFLHSGWIYCFERGEDGAEEPADGRAVEWSVYDADDVLVSAGSAVSGSGESGYVRLPTAALQGVSGRLRAEITARFPGGALALEAFGLGRPVRELEGLVLGAERGSVTLTPLGESGAPAGSASLPVAAVSVTLSRGAFSAPELTAYRGRLEVRVAAADGTGATRVVTKDAAPYLVIVDARVGEPPLPALRPTLRVSPSVTAGGTRFLLDRRLTSPGQLTIYDLGGRAARRLGIAAGARGVDWDGADDAGARLPGGVYFARCRAPGVDAGARVVLLR
jgi:hypothetical protein